MASAFTERDHVRGVTALMSFATALALLLIALVPGPSGSARADLIQVPGDHATIQSAIDAATPGDEILVAPGSYAETIDFKGKAIALRSSGGPEVTLIDGSGLGESVVRCTSGEGPDSVLQGFTITGGSAVFGGGMRNEGSSPTVLDCIFQANSASARGGGMYNHLASPSIDGCVFLENFATEMGGGMHNEQSSPTIVRSEFRMNSANKGGGMRNYLDAHPSVSDSKFIDNTAFEEGGGMDNRKNSNPIVTRCVFVGNTAVSGGGGMHNYVGMAVATGNPVVTSSLFIDNSAMQGGGMRNNDPHPFITNCTFAGNTGGAIINNNGSVPTVVNSILWGNPGGSIIGSATVSFSDIEGGYAGTENLDVDPLFLDPSGEFGNYRLAPGSLCLDKGNNAASHLPATDLDGNSRISNGIVDIGAYEDVSCGSSAECDDANSCTQDVCSQGLCTSDPLVCPPGETCVAGSCDPVVCDADGTCELGESCVECPADCSSTPGAICGNGICEAGSEDCASCAQDCNGKQGGKPSKRFCCGGAQGCGDARCFDDGFTCAEGSSVATCCGDGLCQGNELSSGCEVDCGLDPCGDGFCDVDEDACSCSADCGAAPSTELICTDQLDDDCDGLTDCADSDCSVDDACSCGAKGAACSSAADCCSNRCKRNNTCR